MACRRRRAGDSAHARGAELMGAEPMTARSRLARLLRRFAGDRAGNVLPIVGLAAIPLMGAAGLAIDSTRAFLLQDQLQKALDAAGLAAGHAADQTTAQADA